MATPVNFAPTVREQRGGGPRTKRAPRRRQLALLPPRPFKPKREREHERA